MNAPVLRPLQVRAYRGIQSAFAKGHRRILCVAPTGFGKTVLISHIVSSHRRAVGEARVVVVVHRGELVKQTIKKLAAAGLDHVGVIKAGAPLDRSAPVQVATVQTLLARGDLPPATMLILDEAHHYVSEQWVQVARHYAGAIVLGFTATPERGDGSPLGDIFETLVVAAQTSELMTRGDLVPCDVVAPPKKTRSLSMDPVDAWKAHAENRPTVIFARGVKEGRELADRFNARQVAAGFIDGTTPADERETTLAAFESGAISVLVNVFVLTEGWDCPPAAVCMLARGCDSVATFLQMIGRVLRPHPGKERALLIDLRGAVFDHGMPDEERRFSLEGKPIGAGEMPVKTCLSCAHVNPIAVRECKHCGAEFPKPKDDACGLSKILQEDRERAYFENEVRLAKQRGWKVGYAAHRFQEKFGRFPRKLWKEFSQGDENAFVVDRAKIKVAIAAARARSRGVAA